MRALIAALGWDCAHPTSVAWAGDTERISSGFLGAMSQENVEIVREYFETVNDGDFARATTYLFRVGGGQIRRIELFPDRLPGAPSRRAVGVGGGPRRPVGPVLAAICEKERFRATETGTPHTAGIARLRNGPKEGPPAGRVWRRAFVASQGVAGVRHTPTRR